MFSKGQKTIIIMLTVLILILGGGIYFFKDSLFSKKPTFTSLDDYSTYRTASPSLSPSLKWEQTFGGTGAESLIDAFSLNGKIYVFGNTTSTDYDMTGICGGFLAILKNTGETVSFLSITNDNIQKVIVMKNGFLAITYSPSLSAIKIDFEGQVTKTTRIFDKEESVIKIINCQEGYCVLSSYQTLTAKKIITSTILDENLNLVYKSVTNEAYSLELIDAYSMQEKTIAFFRAEGANNRLGVGIFQKGASPFFRYVEHSQGYIPYRVLPYANGWAVAAIDDLNQAFLLKLSPSFALDGILLFNIGDCIKCDMSYYDGDYYVFAKRSVGGFLATVNSTLSSVEIRTQAQNYTYFNDYRILRALDIENGIKLGIITKKNLIKVPISSAQSTKAILLEDYLIYEGEGIFGGGDVTVCLADI